jgi:uncharacterized protein DUF5677
VPDILDRQLSLAASADVRGKASPVLREIVDYALKVFQRCSITAEGVDTPMGVLFPFLHFIEMLDGTEVLLDGAVDVPARATLRAGFEALLSMEWVATEDSERRGAAYVVAEVHRRLAWNEKFDQDTERGKQLRAVLDKDDIGKTLTLPASDDPIKDAEERAKVRSVLEQPHLKAAAAEYERIKKAGRRTPEFYALWGGPGNLEQLSQRLGRAAYYEILYRLWSGTAHATDLGRQLGLVDGQPAVSRLRSGAGLINLYAHAIYFGLEAIRVALTKYRSEELKSYYKWYDDKIRPAYKGLTDHPEPSTMSSRGHR